MGFSDWFTSKQVLANELAELETMQWSNENNYTGDASDIEDACSQHIMQLMTKGQIIAELNSRERLK